MPPASREAIQKIAAIQKWLVGIILVNSICLTYLLVCRITKFDHFIASISLNLWFLLHFGSSLTVLVMSVIQAYLILRLCLANRDGWLTVVFVSLQFVPCLSLILLLFLNGRATKRLQAAGIRVGLMGAKASDLAAYQPAGRVKCPACGEAIEPRISPCPLCGTPIELT
ncbi:hypothetical protein GC163_11015 [bacterium]|nr:hypothetical protein [bacterium]